MRSLYTSNTILTSFTYIHTENRLLCKYSQGTTAMSYERRVLSQICNRIPPETEEGSGGAPVVSAVLRKLALAVITGFRRKPLEHINLANEKQYCK